MHANIPVFFPIIFILGTRTADWSALKFHIASKQERMAMQPASFIAMHSMLKMNFPEVETKTDLNCIHQRIHSQGDIASLSQVL